MIRAESISMIYKDGTIALEGVSFSIAKGESCSVIGPSGCGKTTLLFILSGLLKPTEGEILINSKNIALILQDYGLFPWKTVYENVSLGLEIRGVKKEEQRKIVLPLLEKLGLKGFRKPLSKATLRRDAAKSSLCKGFSFKARDFAHG